MDEKQKACGRGLKLLEKMRARASGHSGEDESLSVPGSSKSSDLAENIPKTEESIKPKGRGQLLAHLRSQAQQPQQITETEGGVSAPSISEIPRKGRGHLIQLAKESREKALLSSNSFLSSPGQAESHHSLEEQMNLMSLERKKLETEDAIVTRKGELGERVDIALNYVTLHTNPEKGVYEYNVQFVPEVECVAYRYKLISQNFKLNKGIRCYDGENKLYTPEKVETDPLVINAQHPNDNSPVKIILTFKNKLKPKECCQFYNILLNNCSSALNFTRLGRQYFDYRLAHMIPQHKLEIWPGYVTAVEEFEGGIHLCCDIRHRVLRTETAFDVIQNIFRQKPANFKEMVARELLGQCVLTRYNNNLYHVDDIDWNQNPRSTFKLSSGEEISFLDYYRKQYDLHIIDLEQPLLLNKPKSGVGGNIKLICLIPELCYLTGLTDKMRKDMRVMKEVAAYTRITPAQRVYGFQKFLDNLRNNTRAQEMLNDWGIKLAEKPVSTEARILPRENVILKNKSKYLVPLNLEWSKYISSCGVFRGTSIRDWLLIHTKRDSNVVYSFWNMLLKLGPGLGVDFSDPIRISLNDDRIESYLRAIRENTASNIQVVVCICPTPREDRYSAIKKLCCRDLPIPCQIINTGTISRENRLRSITQNVALQINNKVGGASWAIHIPLKNTMLCGIDSYHDVDQKHSSVGAFVASMDSYFTQWFSKTCIQEPRQELVDGLICCFALALRKYLEVNNVLPEKIIVFRDGVSDGQLRIVQNYEVEQFLETCKIVSKTYKPKFSFIVVQKRINTKIYQLSNGRGDVVENPNSGCVLDHTITRRSFYDFFLVSQYVSCGTATPTHYIVLYDTSELKPDLMQRLTYKCCHMYYNWAGTIRVPAPCQYAHKLAYLVGQNIRELPKDILEDKLFYL